MKRPNGLRKTQGARVLCMCALLVALVVLVKALSDRKRRTTHQQAEDVPVDTVRSRAVRRIPRPLSRPKIYRLSPGTASRLARPLPEPLAPPDIDLILGLGADADYGTRLTAVHKIGKHLDEKQVERLRAFLETKHGPESGLGLMGFNAVKNDVLDALLRQETLPEGLGDQILGMSRNTLMDPIWRDYCIQHLPVYYKRRWPEPIGEGEQDLERVAFLKACWEHVRLPAGPQAGTALLSLERLAGSHDEFSEKAIGKAAAAIALDPESSVLARIPAIQMAARMGEARALPAARQLARTGKPMNLRLSAIAAVGFNGTEQDLPLLQGILDGPNRHTRKAAARAIARIKERAATRRKSTGPGKAATRTSSKGKSMQANEIKNERALRHV